MKLGDITVLPLHDGYGREIAAKILTRPGVDDPWSCHHDVVEADGGIVFDVGGFLVLSGDRVILVDAGAGDVTDKLGGQGGKYSGGEFLNSLRAHGFAPEDVTDVCITHLHWDHYGWTTDGDRATFENATYRVHEADWRHYVEAPGAKAEAQEKLRPLESRLALFDAGFTVAAGLDALHTPGHTPGSTCFVVSGGGRRAIMMGDAVHSVVELEERDWEAIFDIDPVAASAARNAIADDLADTDDLVVGAHFPGLKFGRIVTLNGERKFHAA